MWNIKSASSNSQVVKTIGLPVTGSLCSFKRIATGERMRFIVNDVCANMYLVLRSCGPTRYLKRYQAVRLIRPVSSDTLKYDQPLQSEYASRNCCRRRLFHVEQCSGSKIEQRKDKKG